MSREDLLRNYERLDAAIREGFSRGDESVLGLLSDSDVWRILCVPKDKPRGVAVPDRSLMELLYAWPPAADPAFICDRNSDGDKKARAVGIIVTTVGDIIIGKKFLDYGCGDGYVTREAKRLGAAVADGYDITAHDWADRTGVMTDDFGVIRSNGPYDVILLHDVLDHSVGEHPVAVLGKAQSLLAPGGKIYIRFHPWCSRHGTHIFHTLNKAYAHMVFGDELAEMGHHGIPTLKVTRPSVTYMGWIVEAGMRIEDHRESRQPCEHWFSATPQVAERIVAHYRDEEYDGSFPTQQLEQQFHDYVITNF